MGLHAMLAQLIVEQLLASPQEVQVEKRSSLAEHFGQSRKHQVTMKASNFLHRNAVAVAVEWMNMMKLQ